MLLRNGSRFPLIQLPRKSEEGGHGGKDKPQAQFPLIQLPRKSEEKGGDGEKGGGKVSINSTSEEVRSTIKGTPKAQNKRFH